MRLEHLNSDFACVLVQYGTCVHSALLNIDPA
jgi:hypothetical protein